MTTNLFQRFWRLLSVSTCLICGVASQPVQGQTVIYDGRIAFVPCAPGSNPTVAVGPGHTEVRLGFLKCYCEDSKEKLQANLIYFASRSQGVISGGDNPSSQASMTVSGDGTTTKTFYCYDQATVDKFYRDNPGPLNPGNR